MPQRAAATDTAQQRSRRRANGQCTYCQHTAEIGDVCTNHWFMRLAKRLLGSSTMANAQELKTSFLASCALCSYTGVQLTFKTAHGGHRIPVSRGGARTTANVEWMHVDVAAMKGELTREEFLARCAAIAARA